MALSESDWKAIMQRIDENARAAGISALEYRLDNFYWIVDERNNKVVRFHLNPIQRHLVRDFHWLTFILKARQHGVSTFMAILQLDACLFSSNYRAGVVDRTDDEAKKKLGKMKFAYEKLDKAEGGGVFPLGYAIKQAVPLVAPTNDHTMTFGNGSSVYAATTLRGGTLNCLWISEYPYIVSENPDRAQEIAAGSFNTVHPGNYIFVEGTFEGGRYGLAYDMIRSAQSNREPLSQMEWKLLFYGWHANPDYKMDLNPGETLSIPLRLQQYFEMLEKETGKTLTDAQKKWYILKSKQPGVDMARQYPGSVEEALSAQTEGAIYGDEMRLARAQGRMTKVAMDGHAPIFTSWDIGMSDFTSIWLFQMVGQDIYLLDYHTSTGEGAAQQAAKLLLWEREYRPIKRHFLPHDANKREMSGKTYIDLLSESGIKGVTVVPRTPDIWVGINAVRSMLPRCWFNSACEKEFKKEGEKTVLPSGLAALEGYRKKLEAAGGQIKEQPVHNEASHGSDAFRTLGEAYLRRLIQPFASGQEQTGAVRVVRGPKTAGVALGGVRVVGVR